MAQRPVFMVSAETPRVRKQLVNFQYYPGFSTIQRKKCVKSLHTAFLQENPQERVLEISTVSGEELGVKLSAFNLEIKTQDGRCYCVESAFQSSKVFERGGPYKDLLGKPPREAKKDLRLRESGQLKSFHFSQKDFPLQPETYFYNWLYIHALHLHPELADGIMEYTAFTDIAFNPEKSINCQACAAAVYVSLRRDGVLEQALADQEAFLRTVYGTGTLPEEPAYNYEQTSMW